MPLTAYNHLFALGLIFSGLDAYNIGANDVANSFATSVSSRSLTMKQACLAAAIFEFLGAVTVGARVSGTIKNSIISLSAFNGDPGLQMLGFLCALMASSIWLMIATIMKWPVSTTYSIVSAIAGVGFAANGPSVVSWGWNDSKGLAAIWAGLIIAPAMAAGFGAVTYLAIKYVVLARSNPLPWAMATAPIFFFAVAAVLTLSIVYKGAPSLGLQNLGSSGTAAAVVGTAAVVCLLSVVFWLPFVYSRVKLHNYNVRFYHIFLGPLIFKLVPVPDDAGQIGAKLAVPDYRTVGDNGEIRTSHNDAAAPDQAADRAFGRTDSSNNSTDEEKVGAVEPQPDIRASAVANLAPLEDHPGKIEGPWILPKNLYRILRYRAVPFLLTGVNKDIHAMQAGNGQHLDRMKAVYARAKQHGNETEHLYSFMQVMTACTASFAHGANDVSNAIGPLAVIYEVWRTSAAAQRNTAVPVWILVFGGAWIVIGLATYGYNIMSVLGNRLTLHSPSRGTSMELGASITVIIASIYGIPVSTTMCIVGSTIGVGLCNWDFRAVNWRAVAHIYVGWLSTVPLVAVAAGLWFAFIARSPSLP